METINQSINQPTNQSTNQSINQSINWSINQSSCFFLMSSAVFLFNFEYIDASTDPEPVLKPVYSLFWRGDVSAATLKRSCRTNLFLFSSTGFSLNLFSPGVWTFAMAVVAESTGPELMPEPEIQGPHGRLPSLAVSFYVLPVAVVIELHNSFREDESTAL